MKLKSVRDKTSLDELPYKKLSVRKMDSMAKSSEETNKEIKEELGKNFGTKDEVFKVTCDLEETENDVKSMISSTEKRRDPKTRKVCVICKKEGAWGNVKKHIEVNHIDILGHSNIRKICGTKSSTRYALGQRMSAYHKEVPNPCAFEPRN